MTRRISTATLSQRVLRWLPRPRLDLPLTIAVILICGVGLAVLYSASGSNQALVVKQAVRLGAGLVAMLVLARIPPTVMRMWSPALFVVTLALLAAVEVVGEGRGAQRWLDLGVIRFQPSEIAKLTLPMAVAWWLSRGSLPPRLVGVMGALIMIALPCGLIFLQPDLGTALLVAASGCFALFLGGLSWRLMALAAGLGAAALPVLWMNMREYQRDRVRTLLDPESDPLGAGWNIIQSKIAVGSGGLLGKGWGNGSQSQLDFLPERSTDFILAVFAEEFGLLGIVLLLCAYLFVIARSLTIVSLARDSYARLLGGAIALTFSVYVVVNAGMISGLLPVVGVPLPLISYGGTSMLTLLAGFGMVMSAYTHRSFMRR